jgi:hypothetical protein
MMEREPKKIAVQFFSDQIAEQLKAVETAIKAFEKSGVSKRVIVALIKEHNSRLSKYDIQAVLQALEDLPKVFLEKK